MKTKTFDCVEMKRQAQARLQEEYEARRSEFASLSDFLNSKAEALFAKRTRTGRRRARGRVAARRP